MPILKQKKPTPPKRKKKGGGSKSLSKWIAPLLLILLLAASLLTAVYFIFLRIPEKAASKDISPVHSVQKKQTAALTPKPAIALEEPTQDLPSILPVLKDPPLPPVASPDKRAKIAIIIDDMGHHQKLGNALLSLDLDLTFSFLPYGPFTDPLYHTAVEKKRDILLHLPMEPTDKIWDPGPGALTVSMNDAEIIRTTVQDLAKLPLAIGVNNHMGSYFTENPHAMQTLLGLLKKRDLFFVDSMTSPHSTGFKQAREMGLKTAHRSIFLDNDQSDEKITEQLNELISLAEKHGEAVGIGHPYPATLRVIRNSLDVLQNKVQVVGIQELVQ